MNLRQLRRRAIKAVAHVVARPWLHHFVQVGEYRRRNRPRLRKTVAEAMEGAFNFGTGMTRAGDYVAYLSPDPEKEREEFLRELMERRAPVHGEPAPMPGEIGRIDGLRFVRYGSCQSFDTEGDMYEAITGHRSAVIK